MSPGSAAAPRDQPHRAGAEGSIRNARSMKLCRSCLCPSHSSGCSASPRRHQQHPCVASSGTQGLRGWAEGCSPTSTHRPGGSWGWTGSATVQVVPAAESRAGAGSSSAPAELGELGGAHLGTVTCLAVVSSGCFSQKSWILTKRDDRPLRAPKSRYVSEAAGQKLLLGQ